MGELRVGLLAACENPRLFGFELWPLQRELLEDVERHRINVWALGRRSGKTSMASSVCLWDCLFRPDLDEMMRRGEVRHAVAVATNSAQGRLLVAQARATLESSPALSELVESSAEDEIRFKLPSGARTALKAFPCSSRGGRGWAVSTLVLDECAHFLSETDGPATADRVWEAMVPSTAQFGNQARILALSSPYGSDNLFARLFTQASAGELEGAVGHQYSTAEMNPSITADFLATEEARDPDSFQSEYLALFTSSGDAYLDPDRYEPVDRPELEPEQAKQWVCGLDPSFSRDNTGVALVGVDPWDGRKLKLGFVAAWPARGASFDERIAQIAAVANRYSARVVTDQYAAPAVISALKKHGLAVREHTLTATSKTQAFAELRARLYDGTLEIYQQDDLVRELRRLRSRYTAGRAAVELPRAGRSHCDAAMALALATWEHRRATGDSGGIRTKRKPAVRTSLAGDRLFGVRDL